jgi:hypothetical protein
MPYKVEHRKEKQAAAARRHYEKNKDAMKARARVHVERQRQINRDYVRELKESTPCCDCGRSYVYLAMDFDHVTGDKEGDVCRMVQNVTLTRLKSEIAKCEIVCATCHRLRTYARGQQD